MDKNTYLIELSESDRTDFGNVAFSDQYGPQKVFSAVWALESGVNGGGFSHFFSSSEFDTADYTPSALRSIGAYACADIVQRALSVLPVRMPGSQKECRKLIESLDDESAAKLDGLDSEFYQYPDPLGELLFAYVAAHPEVFGTAPECGS